MFVEKRGREKKKVSIGVRRKKRKGWGRKRNERMSVCLQEANEIVVYKHFLIIGLALFI